jgi:hypothetical protein
VRPGDGSVALSASVMPGRTRLVKTLETHPLTPHEQADHPGFARILDTSPAQDLPDFQAISGNV